MDAATTLLIAVGLAMDAVAASVAIGIASRPRTPRIPLLTGALFGGFQGAMPLVGWSAGLGLSYLITGIDHWIAFGLLVLIGSRMIYESRDVESRTTVNPASARRLLGLALATSIDALAVGVGFAFVDVEILPAAATIGVVTFVLSILATYLGSRLGSLFEGAVEVLGGLVLIGIGTRILLSHML
jgi:putative Mn2+ efflux pump MntP